MAGVNGTCSGHYFIGVKDIMLMFIKNEFEDTSLVVLFVSSTSSPLITAILRVYTLRIYMINGIIPTLFGFVRTNRVEQRSRTFEIYSVVLAATKTLALPLIGRSLQDDLELERKKKRIKKTIS
uniref:Uncharacterized protein n=1 Tax=Glossina pallidipes TaxID=7398 RepID=A0A1A9ZBY9_GLOPL